MSKAIHSMTGFGRSSQTIGNIILSVECKSLNSRFLEINCKLPRLYNSYELEIRQLAQSIISRGRLEILVSRKIEFNSASNNPDTLSVSLEQKRLFSQAEEQYKTLGIKLGQSERFEIAKQILNQVDCIEEIISEGELKLLKTTISAALLQLQVQRETEAKRLSSDLHQRVNQILLDTKLLEEKAKQLPQILIQKIQERVTASLATIPDQTKELIIDQSRIAQEVALLVDKSDVTEEIVRLKSHLDLFIEALKAGGLVGKRLDFLCQEIFRELNTLGGKSASAEMQSIVVDCKVELERMREQVQNLE